MAVSPWGPVGPLSPPGGTQPAHPGPLDAGEAHTLHSKLPHTTPAGHRAWGATELLGLESLLKLKRSLNLLNQKVKLGNTQESVKRRVRVSVSRVQKREEKVFFTSASKDFLATWGQRNKL